MFLNIDKLSESRTPGSSLFHLEIVEGKKEFFKKFFTLKMGMLCIFLQVWDEMSISQESNGKGIEDARF